MGVGKGTMVLAQMTHVKTTKKKTRLTATVIMWGRIPDGGDFFGTIVVRFHFAQAQAAGRMPENVKTCAI